MKHCFLSFFSGAGFLDLGLEDAGLECLYASDNSEDFKDVYVYSRKNMGKSLPLHGYDVVDVNDFLTPLGIRRIDSIIDSTEFYCDSVGFVGGPPCPDFSVSGRHAGVEGDKGKLTQVFIDMILRFLPDWFLIENVPGLVTIKKNKEYFDSLIDDLSQSYSVVHSVCNAMEFGVAQDRNRVFIFGVKSGFLKKFSYKMDDFDFRDYATFPKNVKKLYDWPKENPFGQTPPVPSVPQELTVSHWFKKNNTIQHPSSSYQCKTTIDKVYTTPEGYVKKQAARRLHRYRYSPTACYGNLEIPYHPAEARKINAAEALAIQSLPDGFILPPDMTLFDVFKTIGNGVPYLMAKGIGGSIREFLG